VKTASAAVSPTPVRARGPTGRRREPLAPRWMSWVLPQATVVWAAGYGAVRIWWAVGDAPAALARADDLVLFSGWSAVGLGVLALVVAVGLDRAWWHPALLVAAWVTSAALLVASAPLLLDVVGGLLPGLGVRFDLLAFLNRAAACGGGILVGAAAEGYRRRWRSVCPFCGRSSERLRPAQLPGWASVGAYAAIGGWCLRLAAQAAVGFDVLAGGGVPLLVFEIGFVLAGVVLPLALVRPWGRVVPSWMPLLAGRRVPRWLLLAPGFGLAGALTVYFGFTLAVIGVETVTGSWEAGPDALPLAFFWVAVPAYLAWGVGLGVAAFGYHRATRPPCRACAGSASSHPVHRRFSRRFS
jgi:hypothetical protein